jgi:hypothetical protein
MPVTGVAVGATLHEPLEELQRGEGKGKLKWSRRWRKASAVSRWGSIGHEVPSSAGQLPRAIDTDERDIDLYVREFDPREPHTLEHMEAGRRADALERSYPGCGVGGRHRVRGKD